MAYHTAKEVEQQLAIKSATLRKYATKLEAAGYEFERNEQGHRFYRTQDVLALEKLMDIKEKTNLVLEECATKVLEWQNGTHDITDGPVVREEVAERGIVAYGATPEAHEMMEMMMQTMARQESMLAKQEMILEKQAGLIEEFMTYTEEQKRIDVENRMTGGAQETRMREMKDLLERSNDRDQTVINQLAALRNDVRIRDEAEKTKEVQQDNEKNRSWWQRFLASLASN